MGPQPSSRWAVRNVSISRNPPVPHAGSQIVSPGLGAMTSTIPAIVMLVRIGHLKHDLEAVAAREREPAAAGEERKEPHPLTA